MEPLSLADFQLVVTVTGLLPSNTDLGLRLLQEFQTLAAEHGTTVLGPPSTGCYGDELVANQPGFAQPFVQQKLPHG